MERDSIFVTTVVFILFVITKRNWKSNVTAIFGICDANNATAFSSSIRTMRSIRFIYAHERNEDI
jgi:hypothetical protein